VSLLTVGRRSVSAAGPRDHPGAGRIASADYDIAGNRNGSIRRHQPLGRGASRRCRIAPGVVRAFVGDDSTSRSS